MGSGRGLRGEVSGGEGIDDWMSVLSEDMRGKRQKRNRHAETEIIKRHEMEDRRRSLELMVTDPVLDF